MEPNRPVFDLQEEVAAIGSDDRSDVSGAYRTVKDRFGHVPPEDFQYRFLLDSVAGELKERLSVMSFQSERADDGKRHHRRARNHYYWADQHQSHVLEENDGFFAHYHRGNSLFNLGRTMMLEAMLELVPFERYPDAYRYLEHDRRNHEGIMRHMPEILESATVIGMPARSGQIMSNGEEATAHLRAMDAEHVIAFSELRDPSYVEHVIERTKRADRLTYGYRALTRFLEGTR